ncbi:hypothetical protein G7046_g181 [Stylonectria norvegica]|nr:hypothetical protein G7046_g181 [Stylonectria norvegica]
MADRRGAYELVGVNETSTSDSVPRSRGRFSRGRLDKASTYLEGVLQLIRQKRRILLFGGAAFVVSLILLHQTNVGPFISSNQSPDRLADVYLDHLASPLTGHEISNADNEAAVVVGEHHAVSGDYPPHYQWVDPYSREPFNEIMFTNGMNNNAMGRMPTGSQYDMLVIGRGRNDLYKDPTEGIQYANLTIVGFFANYDPVTGEWVRAGPEPYILDLPVWRQYPRPCLNLVNGGAADPRFTWSDAGEPLAIIGTSSRVPGVCKAVGLVDLRAAWPALKEHLEQIGYGDIPIRFDRFTEVGKANKKEKYEKNWAAFFPGPKPATTEGPWYSFMFGSARSRLGPSIWPLFASQVHNRSILEVDPTLDTSERSPDSYVLSKEIDLSIRVNGTLTLANEDCLVKSLPKSWNPQILHQATPFYRVTFCHRGTCVPSRENTVLLGLIHYKKERKSYRRMFVTMSTDAPYQILSVSAPLHFGSVEIDKNVVFSVSMAFLPTKKSVLLDGETPFEKSTDTPGGYLSHGWLDDTIVVGAGLRDEVYDSIHVRVSTALRGHKLCAIGKADAPEIPDISEE